MKEDLNLTPHPEGGSYKEIFRSERKVTQADCQTRAALTHIYFHLRQDEVSKFHQVKQDEIWNLYQGEALKLLILDPENPKKIEEHFLGKAYNNFCFVVKAGLWQAAQPIDSAVLCGCTVAPGFEFEDFAMLDSNDPLASSIKDQGYSKFLI